jgi:hypothetical protein
LIEMSGIYYFSTLVIRVSNMPTGGIKTGKG